MKALFYVIFNIVCINAFVPHPLVTYEAVPRMSITHAEITELAFIRSLARYFYDTRISQNNNNNNNEIAINEDEYFTTEHTIDDLYALAYPTYNISEIELQSFPLKYIIDSIITSNVLVNFDEDTKRLSAAHYDSEAFVNGSRRILQFRDTIINYAKDENEDLSHARTLLGQLFHTLQDFYSHSNWVEMGKTDINELIGFSEEIGMVAQPDQSTCTNMGCTRIEKPCTLWQKLTVGVCPLVYYDCQDNILKEINDQQLLTSGYATNDVNDDNEVVEKPTHVEKCSHGSVLDNSSHIPAVGGINKDSYSIVFSPHANLHKQAADLAIKATERFLNDLRREIGDYNFDRLFAITPTESQSQQAANDLSQGKRFRFFSPSLSTYVTYDGRWGAQLNRVMRKFVRFFKSAWIGAYSQDENADEPTYDLSDVGITVKDTSNFRAAPYVFGKENLIRRKRMIDRARKYRYQRTYF